MTTVDTLALRSPVRWNRALLALTVASVVLAIVAGIGIFTDPRILTGVPIWLKPFKFAVSFVVYSWTLAWMLAILPKRSRAGEWAGIVILGVAVLELTIIVFQVIRGRTSHYNVATPLDEMLWSAMGTSIMVLFFAHVVIAVAALRQRIADRPAAFAIRLGLLISLLGMALGFLMTSQTGVGGTLGAHSVGVADGGPGMPLTGWSTTGGDLRIGHFIGMHALQALPIVAYLLSRTRIVAVVRARLVLIAGGAYTVLVLLLTWQALRAQPLLEPDGTTMIAFAALAAVTAGATYAVTRRA
ncbi:hypothetical protein FB565_002368 [Actinoplanes lutulentus]|uniref:Uncharacterized protein n=1 Tax=Actinoplanes lutulentus TaxID=1287878 RepID=A0A327ZCX1_9ACTN|nr:hypothetical protein [Actinoplanes lutulentus]MBB2942655.1 hypothetical protein [Actinoplanes lutulentus]RAK38236.1 hypothetical protein B0I29_105183 [Actinoplanes lutulentus]